MAGVSQVEFFMKHVARDRFWYVVGAQTQLSHAFELAQVWREPTQLLFQSRADLHLAQLFPWLFSGIGPSARATMPVARNRAEPM